MLVIATHSFRQNNTFFFLIDVQIQSLKHNPPLNYKHIGFLHVKELLPANWYDSVQTLTPPYSEKYIIKTSVDNQFMQMHKLEQGTVFPSYLRRNQMQFASSDF